MLWASRKEFERAQKMLDGLNERQALQEKGFDKHVIECTATGQATQEHLKRQDKTLDDIKKLLAKVFWTVLIGAFTVIGTVLLPEIHVHFG